ncbi:O-antigen ligase family protein [bacterium]|nr:O-antigen ligase family protein [candidate division CSSED10-310 bacterium]
MMNRVNPSWSKIDVKTLIPWISLGLSMLIWPLVNPSPDYRMIISQSAIFIPLMILTRKSMRELIQQCAAAIIVIGCSLEIANSFPERKIFIVLISVFISAFAFRFFQSGESGMAWLTITLGLSTAPYTELHLERNIWVLASCLIGMLHTIQSKRLHIQTSNRLQWAAGIWVILTALTFFSCFWSAYPYASYRFGGILIFNFLVFLQLLATLSQDTRRRDFVIVILSFAGVYCLSIAIAFVNRIVALGWINATGFRIYVFERHPNYTIFFLLLSLPLWLLLMDDTKRFVRLTCIAGMVSSVFYLVFLSYSRQGYLLLICYAGLLLIFSRTTFIRYFIHRFFILSLLLIGSCFLLSSSLRERVMTIAHPAYSLRYQAWKVFLDLFFDHPLLGYGMGVNRYIYPCALGYLKPLEPATRQFLFEAHNAYIDILVSLGVIGLFLFVAFLGICTLSKVKGYGLEKRIAGLIGLGIWIDLLFNFRLHAQDTSIFLMVFLAYAAVVNSKFDRPYQTIRTPANSMLQLGLTIMAILVCATPWLGKLWIAQAQRALPEQDWPAIHRLFHKASVIEPLNAHPHYYMALCDENLNRPEEAQNEYETAVALCPNYPFYRFYLAQNYAQYNRTEDAMLELETAKILEPNDSDGRVRFNLGILEWRLGYRELARQDFFNSILLNPAFISDSYWQTNPWMKSQLINDFINFAGSFFSSKMSVFHNLRHLPAVTDILMKSDREDLAFRCIYSAALNFPDNLDIVMKAVEMLIQRNHSNMAMDLIYYCLQQHPGDSYLLNYLGFLYLNQSDFNMARYCADQSLRNWREISVDNYVAYQILMEVARLSVNRRLYAKIKPCIDFLADGRYARQTGDLTVHIGTNSYLVKPIQIQSK